MPTLLWIVGAANQAATLCGVREGRPAGPTSVSGPTYGIGREGTLNVKEENPVKCFVVCFF